MKPNENDTKITTVFFDFGDTLVEGRPTYLKRITELLGEFGFEKAYGDVVRAFTKADYLLYLDARSGSLSGDGQYLMRFLNHFAGCLEIAIDWDAVLPHVLKNFDNRPYERTLSEGALETLEGLSERGVRLAIISNNDGRCHEKCEELGIARFFETIVDSSREAVRKPSPRIFEIALERMRIAPEQVVHVGDMYGSDVLGARDAGIGQVWYNPRRSEAFEEYRPTHEIENLRQILDIL
ncbi:MAG: YjjG family noncanonical pyrimidine nucleotidase [Candidatus Abyssubacteria bacterium]